MKQVTEKELAQLAFAAGFEEPESAVGILTGESEFDETVVVGEYAVGESLKRLVESLGITVIKE